MNQRTHALKTALANKVAIKAIAGIANFNVENVLTVVRAADVAGVHAVDVAATPEIVKAARKSTQVALFASSIHPKDLAIAAQNGADVVELGNYDALYAEGLFLTAEDVMKLSQETLRLVEGQALVSITIPGHLAVDTQLKMARALQEMGVDLIQTEGASRALTAQPQIKQLTAEEKAQITFANTGTLATHCALPVMTASGITLENITKAFSYGAAAVGVGSTINQLGSEQEMVDVLQQMVSKVQAMAADRTAKVLSLVS